MRPCLWCSSAALGQPTCSRTPMCVPLTWTFISCPTPLTSQLIKGARYPDLVERHLHVEHGEDGQQLAGAELGQLTSLKPNDGFTRETAMGGDIALAEPQSLAPFRHRLSALWPRARR